MLPIALSFALAFGSVSLPAPPSWFDGPRPPAISAEAYILYDAGTETVLLEQRADEQRAMASVTKLMTALVAVERMSPEETTVISRRAAEIGEAEVGLVAGERWTIRDLLTGMLVRSGNDAAIAVAEAVAGTVADFVGLMNEKAAELGMTKTRFANPHGLDADGHHSSARDLLTLAIASAAHPLIARLARTEVVRFLPDPETGKERRAEATNHLLGAYPGTIGLKTGFTLEAGKVLVGAAQRGERLLFAVVMGSEDHFQDTRRLLEYGFQSYGPADLFLTGLGGEEGGGPPPDIEVPEWLRTRLATTPELDDGRWQVSRYTDLPLGEALSHLLSRFSTGP